MSHQDDPFRLREVGYIDDGGRLHTLHISADALPAARAREWMVWDDFLHQFVNLPRMIERPSQE